MRNQTSRLLCSTLLAASVLFLSGACKGKGAKPEVEETNEAEPKAEVKETSQAEPEVLALVGKIVDEYREAGHTIRDTLQVHVAGMETVQDHFNRQQDVLFRENYFESRVALFGALEIPTFPDAKDLREHSITLLTKAIIGYYDWNQHKLVLTPSEMSKLVAQESILIHEVAHGVQGSRFSFKDLLKRAPSTTEGRAVFSCITEGEAEALGLEMYLARQGRSLNDVDPSDLDSGLGRLLSGQIAEAYRVGRAFSIARFQHGGWEEVRRQTENIPASTEQIIHPEKWERDQPSVIEVPEGFLKSADATLIYNDVLGEFGIFIQLLSMGVDTNQAYLSATGWEADRLHVYRRGEDHALLWLTQWDREADAAQFAQVMARAPKLRIAHDKENPRIVVLSHNLELGSSDLLPKPVKDLADAQTTTDAERDWLAKDAANARVVEGRWHHPRVGLSVGVPKGWSSKEVRGMHILLAPSSILSASVDNMTVVEDPNVLGLSLAQTSEQLTTFADGIPELKLVRNELSSHKGLPVVSFHFRGMLPGALVELEAMGFAYLHKGKTITITLTIASSRWESFQTRALEILDDVQLPAATSRAAIGESLSSPNDSIGISGQRDP